MEIAVQKAEKEGAAEPNTPEEVVSQKQDQALVKLDEALRKQAESAAVNLMLQKKIDVLTDQLGRLLTTIQVLGGVSVPPPQIDNVPFIPALGLGPCINGVPPSIQPPVQESLGGGMQQQLGQTVAAPDSQGQVQANATLTEQAPMDDQESSGSIGTMPAQEVKNFGSGMEIVPVDVGNFGQFISVPVNSELPVSFEPFPSPVVGSPAVVREVEYEKRLTIPVDCSVALKGILPNLNYQFTKSSGGNTSKTTTLRQKVYEYYGQELYPDSGCYLRDALWACGTAVLFSSTDSKELKYFSKLKSLLVELEAIVLLKQVDICTACDEYVDKFGKSIAKMAGVESMSVNDLQQVINKMRSVDKKAKEETGLAFKTNTSFKDFIKARGVLSSVILSPNAIECGYAQYLEVVKDNKKKRNTKGKKAKDAFAES